MAHPSSPLRWSHKAEDHPETATLERYRAKTSKAFFSLPDGKETYESFCEKFSLGHASTEQSCKTTQDLSFRAKKRPQEGLELLAKVDETVIAGIEEFKTSIMNLSPEIAEKLKKGGRVIMLGSGTSGRISVDLAAKCRSAYPEYKDQVIGIISGGDSAMIRAKEGFEDSAKSGEEALKGLNLGENDVVFLISASGSASFNVGAGHFAANQGSEVFYFYNSSSVVERTVDLFGRDQNPVKPLLVDTGPQAISGSTRLQAATLGVACLGALLTSTFFHLHGKKDEANEYPDILIKRIKQGQSAIKSKFADIETFVLAERVVLNDPNANFGKRGDPHSQGYITFLSSPSAIREVLIDATETSPTFATCPPRREHEIRKKQAEFRAFLEGAETNKQAWQWLMGKDEIDLDTQEFVLSANREGVCSYENRPPKAGNCVFAVVKLEKEGEFISPELLLKLKKAKEMGAHTGLIITARYHVDPKQLKEIKTLFDAEVIYDQLGEDPLGLHETLLLKQTLNLISNSTMILMDKVFGNQMVDVRTSNHKLVNRAMRIITKIWKHYRGDLPISQKELYHLVLNLHEYKTQKEEKGDYVPSVVKMAVSMLALTQGKDLAEITEALRTLEEQKEGLDWVSPHTSLTS